MTKRSASRRAAPAKSRGGSASSRLIIDPNKWTFSLDRLQEIETALRDKRALSADDRADMLELLGWIALDQVTRKPGRRTSASTDLCASVVRELHQRHGVKLAAAVSAMVREDVGTEESRRRMRQNIERAYRKLKASNRLYQVSERAVLDALERVNPKLRK